MPFSLDDHPYYIICYYRNTNNLFVFFGDDQPTFNSSSFPNGVMFSYARPSYYRYYLDDSGEFTDGWVGPYTHDGSLIDYPVLYSNSNIYRRNDGSLYFAASDPIPLDGYRVVEWDGDPTGLPFNSDWGFYRVSDSVPFLLMLSLFCLIILSLMPPRMSLAARPMFNMSIRFGSLMLWNLTNWNLRMVYGF